MIRILHMIAALERGGSQALVMDLYRHMDRDKIQFDFILDHPDRRDLAGEVEAMGGRIYELPSIRQGPLKVRRAWRQFLGEHREYRVLHSHVRSYASLYLPVAKRMGLRTIIHSHSTSNGQGPGALVKAALQYPLRYQGDVLMSCTPEAAVWLFGKRAGTGEKLYLLKNGADLDRFRPDGDASLALRRELGLEGSYVIGHVGRFHPAKNHPFLLAAFKELLALRPEARLLLVGDGDLLDDIKSLAVELGIEDKTIFTGGRGDVPQLMAAMDLLAFPSLWEGLPVTVIEAQASGLPCLISDRIDPQVDLSPLVERLPIESPAAWARAMAEPRERQDVREALRQGGYDIAQSARDLAKLYERLWNEGERA